MVIHRRRDYVQLEHINVIGVKSTEGVLEALDHTGRRQGRAAAMDQGFGGDHDAVTRHGFDGLANQSLGAVRRGRIQEVHPHIQRLTHQHDGFRLCLPSPQPQTAVPPAAEAGHTDAQPRFPKCDILHARILIVMAVIPP